MGDKRKNWHVDGQKSKRPRRGTGKGKSKEQKKTDLDYISKEDYVNIDGCLYVKPYVFEFKCYFKPRWRDQKIYKVFVDEFRHVDEEYWRKEVRNGRVLCNNNKIDEETIWEDGQQVCHIVHRHESAIIYPTEGIEIIQDTQDYVVVSKPVSIPVHPCGTYRRNSLQFLLRAFYGYENLLCVHRLDKETSGLVILAKNSKTASKFGEEIKNHTVSKTYLAQVYGSFPNDIHQCNSSIHWDKRQMKGFINEETGVECETSFKLVGRNEKQNTSIVECHPVTGRTHQIRIHLAHLGYPIVNDPLYGGDKAHTYHTKHIPILTEQKLSSVTINQSEFLKGNDENVRASLNACEWSNQKKEEHGHFLSIEEEGKLLGCSNCPQVTNVKNVECGKMYIHLHALKYGGDKWNFEVSPPSWMNQDGFSKAERTTSDSDEQQAKEHKNSWSTCSIT